MAEQTKEKISNKIYRVLLPAAGVFGAYLIFQKTGLTGDDWKFQMFLRILFTALILWAAEIWFQEEDEDKKYRKITMLVLTAGCILRIGYMLYTDCTVRAHDLGDLELGTAGKAGYLLLAIKGKLPGSYQAQFYQQPFFYLTGAAVSGILNKVLGRTDPHSLVDAAKTVSCLASCMILFIAESILPYFSIKKKGKLAALSLLAFTPAFYLVAGRVGEDALTGCLMALAILFTLRWEQTDDWQHALLLGLIYGIGMMTKISCSIVGIFTLYIFFRKIRKNSARKHVFQVLLFLAVSLPLGLWYSVRNRILFGQPFTYVLPQSVDGPYYRGADNLVRRFLSLDLINMFQRPYADVSYDVNLPVYLLKTELFGEFRYQVPLFIPVILLFLNLILSVIIFAFGIKILIKKKRIDMLVLVLLFAAFPLYASWSYPFSCSMDFRYYLMIALVKALLLGILWTEKERNCQKLVWLEGLFSLFSILMFGFFPGM